MGTACEEGACNCSFHKPNMMHPAGCDCADCIRQFGRDSAKIQNFTDLKGPVEFEGTVGQATYKGGGYEYAVQFETRNPPRGEGWSMYREIENEDYRNDGAPRDLFVWRRKLTDEQSKNET